MAGIPIDGDIVGIPVELDFLMGNRYILPNLFKVEICAFISQYMVL